MPDPTTSLWEAVRFVLALIGVCVDLYALVHVEDGIRLFPLRARRRVAWRRRAQMLGYVSMHAVICVHSVLSGTELEVIYWLSPLAIRTNLVWLWVTLVPLVLAAHHVNGWIASEEIIDSGGYDGPRA